MLISWVSKKGKARLFSCEHPKQDAQLRLSSEAGLRIAERSINKVITG